LYVQIVAKKQGVYQATSMAAPGRVLKKKIDKKREYPLKDIPRSARVLFKQSK